jgi:crotonobetainyl-CoA:carnitine CoA-transferase CaiB-like acyl-CoA transferase
MTEHSAAPVNRGGPLAGVRVVELTKVWAGPYAGKLLAFLGAEVIKVESLKSIDMARWYATGDIDASPGFQAVNPQKMSLQVDMKTPEGLAALLDLFRVADIVIENLRPGAVKRLGLGYEAARKVKPDIVYVSMSMHGTEGPLSYQTGYAPAFAALSGLTNMVGYEGKPPSGMNIRYGDATFGATAAFAAVVALLQRRRTGLGQFVDVAAAESLTSVIGDTLMDFSLNRAARSCDGNRHPEMAPHGAYRCSCGSWIAIAVSSDEGWRALAQAIGPASAADDARFKTLAARKSNEADLDRLVAAWTAEQAADDLVRTLQGRGIAAAKSASSLDLVSDQHLWKRGFYRSVPFPTGEIKPIVGPSWSMSREAQIVKGAPRLGEHNAYVLGEILGMSHEQQRRILEADTAKNP